MNCVFENVQVETLEALVAAIRVESRTGVGNIGAFHGPLGRATSAATNHHPRHAKPELPAGDANQVWSWDNTKRLDAVEWTWFYLCVILDIFSRYAVGCSRTVSIRPPF